MNLPCSSVGLIPQTGKMGLEVVLKNADIENGEGSAVIKRDNIFLTDGGNLSNSVLVEYVNQMVAAIQGYNDMLGGREPPKGFFVGIQDAEFIEPVRAGDELAITGSLTEKVGAVSFISGTLTRNDKKVAQLVTKIFEITDQLSMDMPVDAGQGPSAGHKEVFSVRSPEGIYSPLRRKLFSYLKDLQITEDSVSFHLVYPASFDAYDGHFPGNPILPGITLLETGILALELFTKRSMELKKVNKMKINGAVLPGQDVACEVKISAGGNGMMDFSAAFSGENRPIAKVTGQALAAAGH